MDFTSGPTSYFERSYLASTGHPADARERSLLAPFPECRSPRHLWRAPINSRQATAADKIGPTKKPLSHYSPRPDWSSKTDRLINAKTGEPLAFEILANSNAQEALLLSYARSLAPLGIPGACPRRR